MRGIKVSSSSSSSEEGTSPSEANERGSARFNITAGRGKSEPKRSDLYQRVSAKGRAKADTMPTRRPGKQEELQPNVEEEECSLMETSQLRNASMVSDLNLSNAVEIEEFEEVELAKTELELKRMGEQSGCGLSYICDDIEQMLEGLGNTSTPKPSTSSDSTHSSMPTLVSVSRSFSTSLSRDSGMPGSSDYQTGTPPPVVFSPPKQDLASLEYSPYTSPTYSPITPKDAVISNKKIGIYVHFPCLTQRLYRLPRGIVSEEQVSQAARTSEAEPRILHKLENEFIINLVNNQIACNLVHLVYAYLYRNLK